uniref:Homeobox domain-containing protein n=1 Tax=Opuntia streptacantha TaxID=393608 RepID=A0A7C9EVW0_OPUST
MKPFFLGKSVITSASPVAHTNDMSISMQFGMMRNSKYLGPTQELLNEFCSLGSANDNNKQSSDDPQGKRQLKKKEKEHWEFLDGDDDNGGGDNTNQNNGGSSSSPQSNLYALNLSELQKRKTKLLGLLEELDRRYRHYCEQMKGVVASFDGVAGLGAANVYTALASKAMSRHFRSLRDAIVGQIKATKKAMGEKDVASAVPGTSRGETPRLRMLDQALRQQRAYQQMTLMETHPWRPQRGLPERSVSILRAWLFEHFLHPYPSDVDKHILARQTGLTRSQVSNWFINARVRLWKPMVEQMYLEETKEEQEKNVGSSSDAADHQHHHHHQSNEIAALIQPSNDQKPTPDQLLRVEPESLSSIINSTTMAKPDRNNAQNQNPHDSSAANHLQQSQFGRVEGFGSIDLDFPSSSTFQHPHAPYGTQNDTHAHQGFGLGGGGGGGNVSLTLGLQQHGGNGVSLAFSPASQGSLFYARDQIDDCQPVHQYSLLDGDQGQNLPYRNLMGAQLLHDFA